MISLVEYISKNHEGVDRNYKLTLGEKQELLKLDREFNDIMMMSRDGFDEKEIHNIDEEQRKFFEARKYNKKYFPKLNVPTCNYEDVHIISKIDQLISKFRKFDCILSQFYIERLLSEREWCQMQIDRMHNITPQIRTKNYKYEDFREALRLLKEHPYISQSKVNRNIGYEEAAKRIQDALDELKYPWKVVIKDDVLARMCVLPNKIIYVQKGAQFDEADIEGLIEHEIKGHIFKRYKGLQTGLYLFVHGLTGKNVTSEGIAVWNSLNNVKKQKINILANIALRFVISYKKSNLDFCELFDYIKEVYPSVSDDVLFKTILRSKRELVDTKLLGGMSKDSDYFLGYKYINSLNKSDRDRLSKWNIGIEQVKYIDVFEKFFKVNKFDPID